MGAKKYRGFTIVESVLFLGVTGVIMAVLLVGVGGTLNRERYKDATSSLQDYFRGQYNLVANVNNSRRATDVCQGGQIIIGGAADSGRGTSDCTIVGRIIHSSPTGDKITSSQVYATVDAALITGTDDESVLDAALLTANPTKETYTLGWGTRVVKPRPDDTTVQGFSILIVRVPTSGLIRTYAMNQTNRTPAEVVGNAIPTTGLAMCVDNSMFVSGRVGRVGVLLAKDAVNSSGVQFLTEDKC